MNSIGDVVTLLGAARAGKVSFIRANSFKEVTFDMDVSPIDPDKIDYDRLGQIL